MKKLALTTLVLASFAGIATAYAEGDEMDFDDFDDGVEMSEGATPNTEWQQGSVDVGDDAYVYGRVESFNSHSIGDTNSGNATETTGTVGFGYRLFE